MSDLKAEVVRGQLSFKKMTPDKSQEEYEFLKLMHWTYMLLNDGMVPTKWLQPTKEGTKVNFRSVNKREEWQQATAEYKEYMESLTNNSILKRINEITAGQNTADQIKAEAAKIRAADAEGSL